MNIVARLLRKNLSRAQVAGFIISNFIGLAIVVAGIQLYQDLGSIWQSEDSFIRRDFMIVNKQVTGANTLGESTSFSDKEIADIEAQPWSRAVGRFTSTSYRVSASVESGARALSTYMFFESIPDRFIDVNPSEWHFSPGDTDIPVIISKDYLALYNFGFASSAGMPQISEQLMGSIPMRIRLTSNDGSRSGEFNGRIVGFSNRLNTILVPEDFMTWSNKVYGTGDVTPPSRLIVDVSSPGDVAIDRYLADHNLEVAGDKSGSQASFLLNVIMGIVLAVGAVITILSLFILMLSISLLMQKNRDKLHALLQLGYPLRAVSAPYARIIILSCVAALILALGATYIFRAYYIGAVSGLGGGQGAWWMAPLAGIILTVVISVCNIVAVRRKVAAAWAH